MSQVKMCPELCVGPQWCYGHCLTRSLNQPWSSDVWWCKVQHRYIPTLYKPSSGLFFSSCLACLPESLVGDLDNCHIFYQCHITPQARSCGDMMFNTINQVRGHLDQALTDKTKLDVFGERIISISVLTGLWLAQQSDADPTRVSTGGEAGTDTISFLQAEVYNVLLIYIDEHFMWSFTAELSNTV